MCDYCDGLRGEHLENCPNSFPKGSRDERVTKDSWDIGYRGGERSKYVGNEAAWLMGKVMAERGDNRGIFDESSLGEVELRLHHHDWNYDCDCNYYYSDCSRGYIDHQFILGLLQGMGCPYTWSELRAYRFSKVLEDFEEYEVDRWWRKESDRHLVAGTVRSSLISRSRWEEIHEWFRLHDKKE
jgi:hypothetical protein